MIHALERENRRTTGVDVAERALAEEEEKRCAALIASIARFDMRNRQRTRRETRAAKSWPPPRASACTGASRLSRVF